FCKKTKHPASRSIPVLAGLSINFFVNDFTEVSLYISLNQLVCFISSQLNFDSNDFVLKYTITDAFLGIIFPSSNVFVEQEFMSNARLTSIIVNLITDFIKVVFYILV